MPRKVWVYDPQSGGRKIPDAIKPRIRQRILDHAQKLYAGKYNRIDVRFRGQFCYIDAYTVAGMERRKRHSTPRQCI